MKAGTGRWAADVSFHTGGRPASGRTNQDRRPRRRRD